MIGFPKRESGSSQSPYMMHGYMGGIPRWRGSEFFAGCQFDVFNIVNRTDSFPRLRVLISTAARRAICHPFRPAGSVGAWVIGRWSRR
jgi:hypothetical protein